MKKVKKLIFTHNLEKAVEAILWIANQRQGEIDVYTIVKVLFFADFYHLNKYGRTICGDNYVALENGPVPSETYRILSPKRPAAQIHFTRIENIINPHRPCNREYLSESDIEALEEGWKICKDASFDYLKKVTHQFAAYKNAWKKRGFKKSYPINLMDLIENDKKSRFDESVYYSENIKI